MNIAHGIQDIATYGSICALATLDRAELRNRLLESDSFAPILELIPQIREMVRSFYSSQYTESLTILDKIRIDCMLDIHLHDKVGTLCEMIRQRALVQYTLPYISIDLGKMATAFSVSTAKLERELADLIMGNKISARIDSKEKVNSGLQECRQSTQVHIKTCETSFPPFLHLVLLF